jgi:hypothetical protein
MPRPPVGRGGQGQEIMVKCRTERAGWKARFSAVLSGLAALALLAAPAAAQVSSVDPDAAIDGDLAGEPVTPPAGSGGPGVVDSWGAPPAANDGAGATAPATAETQASASAGNGTPMETTAAASDTGTYHQDDLIGAAEGVFGKGAEGLGEVIQDLLKKQGEPNAYIVGREGSGAFVLGLRYGSGTLHHKIEGERPVYWTGPSVGFDAGANAGNAFVLVYNLYDSQDLYKRFGSGEGQAYLIGGFHVSYLRRGDVVLIPVRVGAGLRLGANVGYMKFSQKQRWLPF